MQENPPTVPTTSHETLWQRVKDVFHHSELEVQEGFVAVVGKANANAFATSAYQILKTDLGQIAVVAVKAAEGLASGAEKQAAAFAQITTQAKSSGINAENSIVNLLIEIAVQAVKGTFGVAVI